MLTWSGNALCASTRLLSTDAAPAAVWQARATIAAGAYVDPGDPNASLLLEGRLARLLGERWEAAAEVVAERPFSPHEDWKLPQATVSLTHRWPGWLGVGASASALTVERWSLDGAVGRFTAYGEARVKPFRWLSLELRGGPMLYASARSQRADGSAIPAAGFFERLRLRGTFGILLVDFYLAVEQTAVRGAWHNDYGIGERIGLRPTPHVLFGLAHTLRTGLVDETTGLTRSLRVADGRDSRLLGFVEWVL